MKRSKFIMNLITLIDEGIIKYADLEEFSKELKETLNLIMIGN